MPCNLQLQIQLLILIIFQTIIRFQIICKSYIDDFILIIFQVHSAIIAKLQSLLLLFFNGAYFVDLIKQHFFLILLSQRHYFVDLHSQFIVLLNRLAHFQQWLELVKISNLLVLIDLLIQYFFVLFVRLFMDQYMRYFEFVDIIIQ